MLLPVQRSNLILEDLRKNVHPRSPSESDFFHVTGSRKGTVLFLFGFSWILEDVQTCSMIFVAGCCISYLAL